MRAGRAERNAEPHKSSTLRVLLILILLLAAAVAGAVFNLYKSTEKSLSLDFSSDDVRIEFGEMHAAMDYVAKANGDVSPSRKRLDSSSVGSKKIIYTVSKPVLGGLMKPSKEFTLNYEVIDSEAPLMFRSGDGSLLSVGEEFRIEDLVSYGDNADPEPVIECSGSVDTGTAGDYPLHVSVTDASGNKTEWDLTVSVVDELPSPESDTDDTEGTAFSDFKKAYAGDGRSFGIDVSSWQEDIDFEAVKKAGCEFVIIRVGFTTGDDEIATLDNRFKENLGKAKAAGLKTGVYLYSYDSSEEMVRKSADWVAGQLGGEKTDLPVAFDWEEFDSFQSYRISFADLNRMYDAFDDQLSKSGYDCMLYGSKLYLEDVWKNTDKRPVWLAHYTDSTDYAGPYMIWQASATGRIDGIKGNVDLDILYE